MDKKPVILCVDDEQVVLSSLKSQLREHLMQNYLLESAETGEMALEIVDEHLAAGREIPLVLVDYLMPGKKGDQVLIDIHNRSPSTLCIMLTGQADLSSVANAINHEALFRYLSKPWNKEDLLKTIEEVFHRHSLEKNIIEKQKQVETKNIELELLNKQLTDRMEIFYKFVPIEFLKALNIDLNKGHIALGENCQKKIAVVFTDIRSFTDSTKKFSSSETFEFINHFTSVIAPIITKNKGFVDKFIGDAVLSIYEDVDSAFNMILESMEAFSQQPEGSALKNIKLGFSVNFGNVQMGTVGYSERMETTILGTVVNIGAKIEKLNKKYNTSVILTEEAYQAADKNKFAFSLLEETPIPGTSIPVKLYTVQGRVK